MKNNTQQSYFIVSGDLLMVDGHCSVMPTGYVRDTDAWEHFSEEHVEEYFNNSYKIFTRKLNELQNLDAPFTQGDEKELLFMMESLTQARHMLADKKAEHKLRKRG